MPFEATTDNGPAGFRIDESQRSEDLMSMTLELKETEKRQVQSSEGLMEKAAELRNFDNAYKIFKSRGVGIQEAEYLEQRLRL